MKSLVRLNSLTNPKGLRMKTVDVLRRAKEILSDETRWCRSGTYASDTEGHVVGTTDAEAAKFCGLGAVASAAGVDAEARMGAAYDIPAAKALIEASGVGMAGDFIGWNDRRATHADLIDAFDRAILSLTPAHVHDFNPQTHICSCGATANGQPVDYEALAVLADACAEVVGDLA